MRPDDLKAINCSMTQEKVRNPQIAPDPSVANDWTLKEMSIFGPPDF